MNKLVQKVPALGSSVDPEKLALTIKGVLGLVVTILVYFGVRVDGLDLEGLVGQIVSMVMLASAIISGAATLWGVIRKIKISR